MRHIVRFALWSCIVTLGAMASGCPLAPEASAAVPPPAAAADSPEQVVMDVAQGLSEGRLHVVWDAMPPSYQADVTELVHSYGAKVDPELWNKGFDIVRKIGGLLRDQKDIILAMPNIRDSKDFDVARVSSEWEVVVAPVITIAQSEVANVGTLRNLDVRQFLGTTGAQLMQDIMRIAEFSEDDARNKLVALGRTEATLVERDGDTATVRVAQPGEPERTEAFVRVEGRWVPKSMAEDWEEQMQEAREKIAQMSTEKIDAVKPQIVAILNGVDSTIDQLHLAKSPEEFEMGLKMGMMQAFGGIMHVAQAMEE